MMGGVPFVVVGLFRLPRREAAEGDFEQSDFRDPDLAIQGQR